MGVEKIVISKSDYEKLVTERDNYKKGMLISKQREKQLKEEVKGLKNKLK